MILVLFSLQSFYTQVKEFKGNDDVPCVWFYRKNVIFSSQNVFTLQYCGSDLTALCVLSVRAITI